jgi:eukaryotic-like serine/threonine-protein kinase
MSDNHDALSPCELLIGKQLQGNQRNGFWRVTNRIAKLPDATGGHFSVGYIAEHDDGTRAFVKATDIGLLKRESALNPLEKMRQAFNEQGFERTILETCRGKRMDRIVNALDFGDYETTEGGVRDYVFFIIFEIAEGDVRTQLNRERRQSLSWAMVALHNLAVAIQQLHQSKIAHNDIKPSNLLIFNDELQKLADLGRATSDTQIGPWDDLRCVGDLNYAAPEHWYHNVDFPVDAGKIAFHVRQASDLFLMGSMGYFLITGQSLSPLILKNLRPEHWPQNWTGTFQDVTPYLRHSLGQAMQFFDAELPTYNDHKINQKIQEFRITVLELSEPDPINRGCPMNNISGISKYDLQRYISLFDYTSKRLKILESRQ